MIEAENLRKLYADKCVLAGLSFTAPDGCVLGFIGPNGAGKTTAMRILCGISRPTEGRVRISGTDMLEEPMRAKQLLGYLPENAPLHAGMSVSAFLKYCGRMRGLSGLSLDLAVEGAVEKCGLEDVLAQETETLSKGFRRRVCLAQTIMHEPPNLVLDEPTDGLDPDQKRDIRSLISRIRSFTTIIVSTHILEEIDAVCDRVLAIRDGEKVFDGTTSEFRALAPEDGAIQLEFAEFPDEILTAFRRIPGVASAVLERKDRMIRLKILSEKERGEGTVSLERVLAEVASHRLVLLNCERLHGCLEEVFSGIGRSTGEKEFSGQ